MPWYTGWGLNDVMLLAGVSETDEVVFAFTEAREQPGLRASEPMRLAALTAARTVSLALDGLWLPEDAVVLRTPQEKFALLDRPRNTNASPAVFGVAYAALQVLEDAGESEVAGALRGPLDEVRGQVYALAEHPVPYERVAERLALKTRSYDLMRAATTAAVVVEAAAGPWISAVRPNGCSVRGCSCSCRDRRRRCAARIWTRWRRSSPGSRRGRP